MVGVALLFNLPVCANIASGECGGCKWVIDDKGNLVISPITGNTGTLAMWGESWGTQYGDLPWYNYSEKVRTVSFKGTVVAETCQQMFSGHRNLVSVDFTGFDTSDVNDMSSMFSSCTSLSSIDVSELNTSSVTNMSSMFSGCSSLTSLDLSSMDVSNVTLMQAMFYGCTKLASVDLTNWKTGKQTKLSNLSVMFRGCSNLTEVDLSGLNTRFVAYFQYMFTDCAKLKKINLSNWIYNDFHNNNGFFLPESLEILEMTNVTCPKSHTYHASFWFSKCKNLKTIISNSATPSTLCSTFFNSLANYSECKLVVPSGSESAYMDAYGWNLLKIETPAAEVVPGDLNGDGVVAVTDVEAVVDVLIGKSTGSAAADVNGDGKVSVSDVARTIQKMLGK